MLTVTLNYLSLKDNNNKKLLLKDISFELKPGRIYTIIGKNGSGKSTLIKSITGLLDKRFYEFEGETFFNGKDLLQLEQQELIDIRKNKIKYVFQDSINSLDPLKKLDYYLQRFSDKESEINKLLKYLFLPDKKTIKTIHSYELSGGMAQRFSFLLALIADPDLLILDEPTSAIDAKNINLIKLKLKDFISSKNKSALIVTQDLVFARETSDMVALIKDKTMNEFIPTDEFFNSYTNGEGKEFLEILQQTK